MICGMLADDVHDRHACSASVMQIRETVGEAGAKMQERACRPFEHTRIAVGCPGADALEETEHAANLRQVVEGSDKVNL